MKLELPIAQTWDGAPVGPQERAAVRVSLEPGALRIDVDAPWHGDPAPAGPPGTTPRLWEHEVVELFVAGADGRYTEIEIGPHGHHLVLQLAGIRDVSAEGLPLALEVTRRGRRWHAVARLARALLPPGPWTANAYAIHGVGADRRYLAHAAVPGDAPDFHQPGRFVPLNPPARAPGAG